MEIAHYKNGALLKLKNFWIRFVYHAGNDPYTDWAVIFIINTIIVIAFVLVGIWVYFDSTGKFKTQADSSVTSTRKTNVSIQTFNHLIGYFETKKITEESLAVSAVTTPDPSKP